MNQGRIIVITGSPGTGKTTTASIVAKESDTDLFSGHSGKRHNSKKPAYRDSNGFPVRPDERTPGTPGGSKAGFTAFERPEDGGT